MKKIIFLLSMTLLTLSMSLTSCYKDSDVFDYPNSDVKPSEKDPNFKSIVVLSDIHVIA